MTRAVQQSIGEVVRWVGAHNYRVYDPGDGDLSFLRYFDPLPSNRREVYMILRNEEEGYVEGEAQRSGDDRGVEATGSGAAGRGCRPRDGRLEAHDLRVEGNVWRSRCERG